MRTGRVPSIILAIGFGVAAALFSGAGGCGLRQRVRPPVAQPEAGWTAPTAVDIENFHGSVRIVVDPTVTQATPVALVRTSLGVPRAIRATAKESVKITTRTIEEEGRNVLRVRTSTRWKNPAEVWVNLTVRVPRCDGARVWNRGGKVEVVGVSGSVLVDNGELFGSDGDIELRTAAPMIDPVALITTRGSVVYQIADNSSGDFELIARDGEAEFACGIAKPDRIHYDGKTVVARLNGGGNPIKLTSGKGLVRAEVMNRPEHYTNRLR